MSESRRALLLAAAASPLAAACGGDGNSMGTSSPGSAAGAGGPSSTAGLPLLAEGQPLRPPGLLANESRRGRHLRGHDARGPGAVRVPRRAADGRARLQRRKPGADHRRHRGRPRAHPLREPDCRPALDRALARPGGAAEQDGNPMDPVASGADRLYEFMLPRTPPAATGTTRIRTCTPPSRWPAAWPAPSSSGRESIRCLPESKTTC